MFLYRRGPRNPSPIIAHYFAVKLSPGGATVQLCRRFWLVESHMTSHLICINPLLLLKWGDFGHCFAVILSSGGATGQVWLVSTVLIDREPYDITPHLHKIPYYRSNEEILRHCFAVILSSEGATGQSQRSVASVLIGREPYDVTSFA